MMIYERGNAAKQWIFEQLDRVYGDQACRVLDLAGGSGRIWNTFLESHKNVRVTVIDTDAWAIRQGQQMYQGNPCIELRVADAQQTIKDQFDVVVAMSAIEHVVDRPAFLRTVFDALSSGGNAYLNYDDGHFRTHELRQRVMVPVSQLLAMIGIEGPYMKHVDDKTFRASAESLGFVIVDFRKHHLMPLKGFMRGASDEALREWFLFEQRLNQLFTPEKLDEVMWSSTLVVQKP